jgi:hypothetical protein
MQVVMNVVMDPKILQKVFGRFTGMDLVVHKEIGRISQEESRKEIEGMQFNDCIKQKEEDYGEHQGQGQGHGQQILLARMIMMNTVNLVLPVLGIHIILAGVVDKPMQQVFHQGENQQAGQVIRNRDTRCSTEFHYPVCKNGNSEQDIDPDHKNGIGAGEFVQYWIVKNLGAHERILDGCSRQSRRDFFLLKMEGLNHLKINLWYGPKTTNRKSKMGYFKTLFKEIPGHLAVIRIK